jgi:hypothetical protein
MVFRRENPDRPVRFARRVFHRRALPARGDRGRAFYSWSKEFLESGKKRLAGDTQRQASIDEVKDLRQQARDLKEVVADLTLENRLLKKA